MRQQNKTNYQSNISKWVNEGGSEIEPKALVLKQDKLPKGVKIILSTIAPLFVGVLAILSALVFESHTRFIFYFIATLSFAWFVLQLTWVERDAGDGLFRK